MKHFLKPKFRFASLLFFLVLASCSSSENTVVINDAPTSSGQADSTRQSADQTGNFLQLTIGENEPIPTLDPLFVENASGMRALQLMYEGLVRYDKNGKIIPAAARDWAVSNHQKTYRFTLHSDLFYHDSNVFNNGRGRRVAAADVKKDFERMAKATVPENAARLFMNIMGFEPYFQEQRYVMRTDDRQLSGVNGITVPNDSTIVFTLVSTDEHFLQKLASPYAVIYPPESVTGTGFKAVGSGPFRLSQQRSDSLYIFARFDNYHEPNQPGIDRVDVITSRDEMTLLNALSRGDIQIIPNLGLQQIEAARSDGQLKNMLSDSYRLANFEEPSTYKLQYNPGADISKASVNRALHAVQNSSFFDNLPAGAVQLNWNLLPASSASEIDSLSSSYSSDPFLQSFYSSLSRQLAMRDIVFKMNESRVANRNIALFTTRQFAGFGENESENSNSALATLRVETWALIDKQIQNATFNEFPWWIDLRTATAGSTNNQ